MMRKSLSFIVLALVSVYGLQAQIQHFTWQGVEREYIVHTPSEYSGTIPVLFFLHYWYAEIVTFDQEFNIGQMAEDYGWAIVVPQALDVGMGTMWNAGLTDSDVDDSGFLMALLDSLTVQYHLNPDSVFFTGFSMGGFMTHRMAIEHGDRITACAPVSGLITNTLSTETPIGPVRMLHIHGTNDDVVGYNGYSDFFNIQMGIGVDDVMAYWRAANGCNGEPTIDTFPDLKEDWLRFIRYTYDCGTDLQLLKVVGGIHFWYNSTDLYDVDYKDVIYNFFTGNSITPGLTVRETDHLVIYPNPTTGIFNVQLPDSDSPITEIWVFDMYGRLVDFVKTVSAPSLQTAQIDLSRHPDGVYFLKGRSDNMAKVVVAR